MLIISGYRFSLGKLQTISLSESKKKASKYFLVNISLIVLHTLHWRIDKIYMLSSRTDSK